LSIIKSDQFESFLGKPLRGVAKFLLHGNEPDLPSERARRLAPLLVDDAADPFQLVRLSADTLAKDPGRLADEANAISMFGGKRVIWVEAGGRDLSALIAPLMEGLPEGTSLLIEADNLKKGTPLRLLFETRPDAAAIECYAPPPASLGQMLDAEAAKAGVVIDRDTRELIVATLAGETGTARGEIAKLMLFAGNGGTLQSEDVVALLAGAGAAPADALVDLAMKGDVRGLERAVGQGFSEADAQLAAMRLAARALMLLEMRHGGEPAQLFRLPFPVKQELQRQANAWAPEVLAGRLPSLLNLLVTSRRSGPLAPGAAFRALASFALAARRGRE